MSNAGIPQTGKKRKTEAPRITRKSKRLAESKDVTVSLQHKNRKTVAPPKTCKSRHLLEPNDVTVNLDTSSDSINGISDAEVEVDKKSDVHLGSFNKRAIVGERLVAVNEFKDSLIPNIIDTCMLKPICSIEGRVNFNLVREFYAGIDNSSIDLSKMTLVSVVRGRKIVLTPDALAKFMKFARPLPDEP